jgi:hypothetical protein
MLTAILMALSVASGALAVTASIGLRRLSHASSQRRSVTRSNLRHESARSRQMRRARGLVAVFVLAFVALSYLTILTTSDEVLPYLAPVVSILTMAAVLADQRVAQRAPLSRTFGLRGAFLGSVVAAVLASGLTAAGSVIYVVNTGGNPAPDAVGNNQFPRPVPTTEAATCDLSSVASEIPEELRSSIVDAVRRVSPQVLGCAVLSAVRRGDSFITEFPAGSIVTFSSGPSVVVFVPIRRALEPVLESGVSTEISERFGEGPSQVQFALLHDGSCAIAIRTFPARDARLVTPPLGTAVTNFLVDQLSSDLEIPLIAVDDSVTPSVVLIGEGVNVTQFQTTSDGTIVRIDHDGSSHATEEGCRG